MTLGTNFKFVLVIVGIILAIIGIVINNWKLSAIGNTIALLGILFN